jgi:hypothetical protein
MARTISGASFSPTCHLFLTGTESSFVTGAALAVDGGRTFH